MPLTVKAKGGKKVMASFRISEELVRELEKIVKEEGVEKIDVVEGWFKAGVADYKKNGLVKI